uniref:Sushi domain-containing protein n=1 Tax=Leptobrachium leishanense TaxID=445787 RepID=A0A8C5LKF4_9ANUR
MILIMNSQSTSRMKVYFIFLISIVTGVKGDCRNPPRLPYAELTTPSQSGDTFTTDQKVLYSCRPGYIRTGTTPNSLTCLADSTWSSPATPFCELRKCPVPEEISNGRAGFDTITFGSTVTYKCDEGYKFISKVTTRECQPDGTWSGVPPVCEVQVCVPPSPVVDGSYSPVKDEYEYSNSVLYSCNSGLSLIGNSSIFCKADATWSAAAPECRDVKCLDPNVENSERESGFTGPYRLNSAITFKCKSGFVMDGSASIKCDENSAWSPLPPTCKVGCAAPIVQNADISLGLADVYILNSNVTFACHKDFVISGSATVMCSGNGQWTPSLPKCQLGCAAPIVQNADISVGLADVYILNSNVTFACRKNFVMTGSATVMCSGNGQWAPLLPICQISCPVPHVQNAEVLHPGPYLSSSTVTIKCAENFTLSGSSKITCNVDGQWAPALPQCLNGETDGGSQEPDNEDGGNHVGAIVGGIIGALVLIAIIVGIIYYKKRQGSVSPSNSNYKSGDTPDGKSTSHQKPVDQAPMNQIQSQNQQEIPC